MLNRAVPRVSASPRSKRAVPAPLIPIIAIGALLGPSWSGSLCSAQSGSILVESTAGFPALTAEVSISVSASAPIEAASFGILHDAGLISPLGAELGGALDLGAGGVGPDFAAIGLEATAAGGGVGVTFLFVVDFLLVETLAAGNDHEVLRILYDIAPLAPATTALLELTGTLAPSGAPPTALRIASGGVALPLTLDDGAIQILLHFVRGDANLDGVVDLADAVATLAYLFGGASPYCLDSLDADDNEAITISDAFRVLQFLFSPSPPAFDAPFPGCGVDPTGGSLPCLAAPYACP